MFKKILNVYKLQIAISFTLAITLIATKYAFNTTLTTPTIIIGVLIGTFILELDYFVYAYILEPKKSFSISLKGFLDHKDFAGALDHIYYNREEVKEKTLNNVLFQMVLAGISLFVVSSTAGIFVKALVLSTYANSIYKMAMYYFDGKAEQWFWALKKQPTENGILVYGLVLFLVLVYSITLF